MIGARATDETRLRPRCWKDRSRDKIFPGSPNTFDGD